jgi:hypothetical protein
MSAKFYLVLIKKNGDLRNDTYILNTCPEAIKEVPWTVGLMKLETSPILSTITFSYSLYGLCQQGQSGS